MKKQISCRQKYYKLDQADENIGFIKKRIRKKEQGRHIGKRINASKGVFVISHSLILSNS
jgi:hypothetical protein